MRVALLAMSIAALMSGCATEAFSGLNRTKPEPVPVVTAPSDGSFSLTAIDDAALPAGKCGMILWTLDASAPKAIMRYVSGQSAQIEVNGEVVDLVLAESQGSGEFGISEQQTFSSASGYLADVSLNFGLGFDGGIYVERGFIKVSSPTGWEVVAPAAGIAGCRAG